MFGYAATIKKGNASPFSINSTVDVIIVQITSPIPEPPDINIGLLRAVRVKCTSTSYLGKPSYKSLRGLPATILTHHPCVCLAVAGLSS